MTESSTRAGEGDHGRIFAGVKQIVANTKASSSGHGDGVVAFFGIPRGHEDDLPERSAPHWRSMSWFGFEPQYESRVGAPLTMHSGINTGLVVTADVTQRKEPME